MLSITIDLSEGVTLRFSELSDGSIGIAVVGAASRLEGKRERQILGNHKAKFADLLAALEQDRVREAAEWLKARDAVNGSL